MNSSIPSQEELTLFVLLVFYDASIKAKLLPNADGIHLLPLFVLTKSALGFLSGLILCTSCVCRAIVFTCNPATVVLLARNVIALVRILSSVCDTKRRASTRLCVCVMCLLYRSRKS